MNITHRDIKPENIMFSKKGDLRSIKFIDFGLSHQSKNDEFMETITGTDHYLAPEMFNKKYTSKVDIWAMGIVLYAMITKKFPFNGNSTNEIK